MYDRKPQTILALVLCGAVAALSTGCRDLRSFKEVEGAFENPSGHLDDATVPDVLNVSLRAQEADGANRLATSHADVPRDVGSAVDYLVAAAGEELGTSQQALLQCSPNIRFRSNMSGVDKVIFDCGDTGSVTGSLTLDLDWKGDELRGFYLDYDMFCEDDRCIDGSMGARWNLDGAPGSGISTSLLATARFEVIRGDRSDFVDWAWRILLSDQELRFEWLVFTSPDRSGDSFVLSAVASVAGGHLEVRDAAGWWRCEYGEEALEGACFRCTPEGEDCVPVEDGGTLSWSTATG